MLSGFPTEELKLIKSNGDVIESLVGLVSRNSIHTEDVTVQIEEGDIFERVLPNGITERYLVTDSGFKKGMGSHIPDHYQTKVEKITKMPKVSNIGNITVTNEGGNVNINSTDNSMRVEINSDDDKLFKELIGILSNTEGVSDDLVKLVNDMKDSTEDKAVFAKKYSKFIEAAADHMSIIAPFLPALSAILL